MDAAVAGDEIRVAAGTYPLAAGADQIALVEKTLAIRGGFTTSDWTNPDPQTNPTILNALGQGRAMVISGTVEVTVEGLRMTYGNAEGLGGASNGDDAGGALYINGADVTLSHSWIMTSTTPGTGDGGGMYVMNSPHWFVMDNCLVQANYAEYGAGIYLREITATLTNNIIRENNNEDFGDGAGLRIYDGSTSLSRNLISGNEGGSGAGLSIAGGNTWMDHNTIEYNKTWASGGGIDISGSNLIPAYVWMDSNLIQYNSSQGGGGIFVEYSTLTMLRNTLLYNDAKQAGGMYGGGLNLDSSSGETTWCYGNLFQGNRASYGGAIYIRDSHPTHHRSQPVSGKPGNRLLFLRLRRRAEHSRQRRGSQSQHLPAQLGSPGLKSLRGSLWRRNGDLQRYHREQQHHHR